ncbi:sigma-70 family RNA polymerase sigma factor [soil metagenome]
MPPTTPDPDAHLVSAARAGDSAATSRLLTAYQDRLFGVCLRMLGPDRRARQTAADLTQDALVKVISGLSSFDGASLFSTWAIRVTMNVVFSHLRAQRHREHVSLDAAALHGPTPGSTRRQTNAEHTLSSGLAARELSAGSGVEQEQERRRVAAALATLDPAARAMLVLRDVRGLEYDQIAAALDLPLGTVKSKLFRARLALRSVLEKTESNDEANQAKPLKTNADSETTGN